MNIWPKIFFNIRYIVIRVQKFFFFVSLVIGFAIIHLIKVVVLMFQCVLFIVIKFSVEFIKVKLKLLI